MRTQPSKFKGRGSFNYPALVALLFFGTYDISHAGSATWKLNPENGDWNSASNWMPATVPNGAGDEASLGASSGAAISIDTDIEVSALTFKPGASAYTLSIVSGGADTLFVLSGAGITNDSDTMQNLVAVAGNGHRGVISFDNGASAGELVAITNSNGTVSAGGVTVFGKTSSAGGAFIANLGGAAGFLTGGATQFFDTASADRATITDTGGNGGPGEVDFFGNSSAGNATFVNTGNGFVQFLDEAGAGAATFRNRDIGAIGFFNSSTAGTSTVTNEPVGIGPAGGVATFNDHSTADHSAIVNNGSAENPKGFGWTSFDTFSSAGSATITNNGSSTTDGRGGYTVFAGQATAESATLIAVGEGGKPGGRIDFTAKSGGGTARVQLQGSGRLIISNHAVSSVGIGSLEGEGSVLLGGRTLEVGGNSADTVYSGIVNGAGALNKTGAGSLTLSGANTYTGGSTVSGGILAVTNTSGSGTGAGRVSISAGTLGGAGTITGPVTVGTGSGGGASLAPMAGAKKPATLTIQSALTFKADATYTYALKAKKRKSQSDQVIANGVTIESGAKFDFIGQVQGKLRRGTSFSVISNTGASAISGRFANLVDGAILSLSNTNLRASYSGGDGNDLTLTVVP